MRNKILIATLLLSVLLIISYIYHRANTADDKIETIVQSHYNTYKNQEYFSGLALSIYKPGTPVKNYFAGQVSHDAGSQDIGPDTLFEIGSITKSFTAAIILQLEKENKLELTETIKDLLPAYSKWSALTIKSLLNMTSGLPNYSDSPLLNYQQFNSPERIWTNAELVQFVYPPGSFSPPLKTGYFYTNTSYILAAMIIEKLTGNSFKTEIENRLFKTAGLDNTYYPVPDLDQAAAARLAHGYSFNPYSNPELVGKDMQKSNLSWAAAAGAVISNPVDIIKWVKALFIDNKIVYGPQKTQLVQLVSIASGKPIESTSSKDEHAFGLGIVQGYDKEIGQYWFYEGETEGFRALYMYVPSNGIIISSIFNSSVNTENDHAGELMKKVYKVIKDGLIHHA